MSFCSAQINLVVAQMCSAQHKTFSGILNTGVEISSSPLSGIWVAVTVVWRKQSCWAPYPDWVYLGAVYFCVCE